MKQIILAAGYATRLYPLTENTPKPLLPIAGVPMIEHVLASSTAIGHIDHTTVVTNNKFAGHFKQWLAGYCETNPNFNGTIINDGTTSNEDRLGAIGDMHLVLEQESIDDDVLVIAGDNLFTGDLSGYGARCRKANAPVLGLYDVDSTEEARKYGVVSVDDNDRLTGFEEKPNEPQSTLIGIALYFYPRATLPEISRYIEEGNNTDQPGRLIQWLYPQQPVYTWLVPGTWLDIGSRETLQEANRIFADR
ncbi:MAG: nucleotidyltransferase family protein [Verrucomicrobiota bacterium]|jgi:glucose-1-phosphate thymidylyltransferase|nr:nucleotidyltransferase family protein [Verrucomicrobiota bacterium]